MDEWPRIITVVCNLMEGISGALSGIEEKGMSVNFYEYVFIYQIVLSIDLL